MSQDEIDISKVRFSTQTWTCTICFEINENKFTIENGRCGCTRCCSWYLDEDLWACPATTCGAPNPIKRKKCEICGKMRQKWLPSVRKRTSTSVETQVIAPSQNQTNSAQSLAISSLHKPRTDYISPNNVNGHANYAETTAPDLSVNLNLASTSTDAGRSHNSRYSVTSISEGPSLSNLKPSYDCVDDVRIKAYLHEFEEDKDILDPESNLTKDYEYVECASSASASSKNYVDCSRNSTPIKFITTNNSSCGHKTSTKSINNHNKKIANGLKKSSSPLEMCGAVPEDEQMDLVGPVLNSGFNCCDNRDGNQESYRSKQIRVPGRVINAEFVTGLIDDLSAIHERIFDEQVRIANAHIADITSNICNM